MDRTHSSWTVRGFYLLALVLVVSPLSDLLSTVWPPVPGDLAWRYGFLGLSAGYVLTPLLGLVLATAVAHWTGSAPVLRVLGVAMGIAAVLLLLAMAIFAFDVVQMRQLRPAEARRGIVVGAALQELKYGAAALVLAMVSRGALRTAAVFARLEESTSKIVTSTR